MGVNFARVSNHTGRILHIVTYNATDHIRWIPWDRRQVPVDGRPITVDSLLGHNAVKVAVIYGLFVDGQGLVCDLFHVPDGSELMINAVDPGSGVTSFSWEGEEVIMEKIGMVVYLDKRTKEAIVESIKAVMPVAGLALRAVPGLPVG